MAFLITNDDGIDAPGILALHSLLNEQSKAIIVAPATEQSGIGHRVTDRLPIRVDSLPGGHFAVHGTPADCTRLGLTELATETEWVLSGINQGGNLSSDIYMSGTVAAAREAALLGKPAIAFSQYRRHLDRPVNWQRAATWAKVVLEKLLAESIKPGEFWNVNMPDPGDDAPEPSLVFCSVDPGHHTVAFEQTDNGWHYCGRYQQRQCTPGCDVDVCFAGNIAVSRLSVHSHAC